MQNPLSQLKTVLHCNKYCTICLENKPDQEIYHVESSVLVIEIQNEAVTLRHILMSILGCEVSSIFLSDYLCKSCKESAIQSYTFIEDAKHRVVALDQYVIQLQNKTDQLISYDTKYVKSRQNVILVLDELQNNLNEIKDEFDIHELENENIYEDNTYQNNISKRRQYERSTHKVITKKKRHRRKGIIKKSFYDIPLTVTITDWQDNTMLFEDQNFELKDLNRHKQLYHSLRAKYHIDEELRCQLCDIVFNSERVYVHHMRRKHRGVKLNPKFYQDSFTCNICQKVFRFRKSLFAHWDTHDPFKIYKCRLCNIDFESKYVFDKHIKTLKHNLRKKNKDPKQVTYLCSVCQKQFDDITNFNTHMTKHGSNEKHKCIPCKMEFATRAQYDKHVKMAEHRANADPDAKVRVYYMPRNLLCSVCQKQFDSHGILIKHLQTHGPEEKHKCEPCFLDFNTRQEYIRHTLNLSHVKRIDTDQKYLLRCDYCDYGTYNKGYLRMHIDQHLGVKYDCNICGKQFATPLCLKSHLNIHSGKRKIPGENSKRICNLCGKVLGGPSAMKKHMRLHTGERPYPCDECEMSFISASHRSTHKKKKHMEKSIGCPLCGKMFYLVTNLRSHIKKTHWKSDEKFDYRKLKGLSEDDYKLFEDRRKIKS